MKQQTRDTQIENARHVVDSDTAQLREDWWEHVNIAPRYMDAKPAMIQMLEPFAHMWDGHLGHIHAATHRIELVADDTLPVHCAPYRAGPNAREFERQEMQKMVDMGVIEPAQTEWASPIVFVP